MEKFQQFFRIMMLVLLEKEFVLKSLNAAHMTAECPIVYYMDMGTQISPRQPQDHQLWMPRQKKL